MIGRVALLVTFKKVKPKPQSLSRSHIRDLAHIMETKIFKRKRTILNDIAGRLFLAWLFLSGAKEPYSEVIDWVLFTMTALMALSIVLECMRFFRPFLVLKEGNQLVFVGLFKSVQISRVNFKKKLGQHWIALESDRKKKVGNIMVRDLDEESVQTIRAWS